MENVTHLADKRKLKLKLVEREAKQKQVDLQCRTFQKAHELVRNLQRRVFSAGPKTRRSVQNLIEGYLDPLISRM